MEGSQQVPLVGHHSDFSGTQGAVAVPSPLRSGSQPWLFLGASVTALVASPYISHFYTLSSLSLMTPTLTLSILNFLCSGYSVVLSLDWTLPNPCHWDGIASNLPSQTTSQCWDSSGASHQAFSLSISPHRCPHPVSWP